MRKLTTKKGTELPLVNLQGKDYLQVAHRLVWFREEHPDWTIETELVFQNDQSALGKATIKTAEGRVVATAHKEESAKDFPRGHREKAETGAIGRALALCGYGTQFEPELDEGSRVVDSPLQSPGRIFPDQPGENDGIQGDRVWTFSFGKWARKTVEQVYNEFGGEALMSYCNYLDTNAEKTGKLLSAAATDAIKQIEDFLGAMENRKPE